MTTVAGSDFVFPMQWKLCLVVIEAVGFPSLDVMALVAILSQTFFMRIILLMAVIADRGRITVFCAVFMATHASKSQVRAFKDKIGLAMIKGVRVKIDDIGSTAYVFGMAALALKLLDIIDSTMKSTLFLNIRGNLLMAIEAQMFLGVFAERFVTLLTLCLIFGMGVDYLARHYQCFKAGRAC